MTIREKGYANWEGETAASLFRWLPIFLTGVRSVFRKKFSKLLFSLTISPFLVFLIAIYVTTKPELKILAGLIKQLKSDAMIFQSFYTNEFLVFMLVVVSIFSGADLISADLRFKALPLYFSRPLSKADYLAGKMTVILFYLLLFTLIPGLLLLVFKIVFTGRMAVSFSLLAAITIFPIIVALFFGSLTLALSILSANSKLIKILIFLVYIFSDNIARVLKNIFHNDLFYLFSIPKNVYQLGAFLFRTGEKWNYPPGYSALLMAVLTLVFISLLYQKIRKAEASA